jgi:plastocyanin
VGMTGASQKPGLVLAVLVILACGGVPARGQYNDVTMRMAVQRQAAARLEKSPKAAVDAPDIVVWLKPLDAAAKNEAVETPAQTKFQLVQHNKTFQPHVLVVPVGSVVDFPNHDPFFHNVFSLFDGKRFDLGLYEAGATNSVRFDRLGVSYLFCNIHPEMSAVVVAVDTPYYGHSDRKGNLAIRNVPDGRYELHVWYERSLPEDLKNLTRVVTLSSSTRELGTIQVPENPSFTSAHKNKYGQDYTTPPVPSYSHP